MPTLPRRCRVVVALLALALSLSAGCTKDVKPAPPPTPAPTFTGPAFLQGTIGSLCTVRGMEPQLVSGWGLVVGLPGSGSTQVPAFLRQWMLTEMRRGGVGSVQTRDLLNATPEQILASGTAAVVAVEGFIPPGAPRGTRFDVLVSALPQTDTTSLEGGLLWMTNLSLGGANEQLKFTRKLAVARGPMYLNPFDADTRPVAAADDIYTPGRRQAVVLSGGAVVDDRKIELILNQLSWIRSRLISDRINERFQRDAAVDRDETAVAKTNQVIEVNIPARFARRPEFLINLIGHLFLQRGAEFEPQKAQELADLLRVEPRYAADVVVTWQTLGKLSLGVIRQYYADEHPHLRLAALEAGARLGDMRVVEGIDRLTRSDDPAIRKQAVAMLSYLPSSEKAPAIVSRLFDDSDRAVRIAAYETAVDIDHPGLHRTQMGEGVDFKFFLDLVPAQEPLIYFTQKEEPRLVIFNPMLGFNTSGVMKVWENHLMIRPGANDRQAASVFYQAPGQTSGKTVEIAPTVANLVFLLAHSPTKRNPADGFNLSYSQVINAIFTLGKEGNITAPLEVQLNPLAKAIARARQDGGIGPRPDTAGSPDLPPAPAGEKPATEDGARRDSAPPAEGGTDAKPEGTDPLNTMVR